MFEVAIICALEIESTAVEAILDDVYDAASYGKAPGDTNAYTLGRIGPHHVVLTYLPSIGKASAAAAATRLALSFNNIRLGLLVGICGGVPFIKEQGCATEIVLGDVVIGTGVVQYDFGRQYDVGRTVRKCSLKDNLSRSSAEMRSFLHKCQAGIERRAMQEKLQHYIEDICAMDEYRAWRKPAFEQDLLYESDYLHQHRGSQQCSCSHGIVCAQARETACDELGCSTSRTVPRHRQAQAFRSASALSESQIHWGWIASGDSVIRSAKVRDSIAAEEDVIAFDMEGSGLWEIFPTLVIKGVCDYADSHKNKKWQKFAALTAAAGAKALLNSWVPANAVTENDSQHHSGTLGDSFMSTPALMSRRSSFTSRSPIWLVPFGQQEKLIGRSDEVERLKAMLFKGDLYARTAIEGLGGIGKSRLALEIASWASTHRNDLSVFWIQCSSLPSFERDCRRVIESLEVAGARDLAQDPKVLMHRHLSQDNARPWLLILDSADDEQLWSARAQATSKLINYIPTGRQGVVLATTRNHRIAVDIAGKNIVRILELHPQDSRVMLQDLIGAQTELLADAEKTTQLLDHLTHLPLAIVQAAAYINQNNLDDIDEYLQIWNDQNEDEIMEILSEEFVDNTRYQDEQNPVAKTWLISFKSIKAQYPLAVQVLSYMACLDPKDMLQSCLPPIEASMRDRDRAFGTLKNYAFIQVQQRDTSDKIFDMHRLVHLAVRNYLRHEGRFFEYMQRTSEHLLTLMPHNGTAMTSYWHKYLHHAERVVLTVEIADELVKYELLEVLADAYLALGSFAKSIAFRQTLTLRLEENPASGNPRLVRNIAALSKTLIRQGRYEEALSTAQRAFDLYDPSFDHDDVERIGITVALADANRSVGSCETALQLAQEAVQIVDHCGRKPGGSRTDMAVLALQTLSVCYQSLQRFRDQERVLLKAIGLLKTSAGPDQAIRRAELNMQLARVYCGLEQTDAAERLLIPVKRMLETHLGKLHRLTLSCLSRLGEVYFTQERYHDAELLYRSLLSMYAEAGRLDDSDVLHDRNSFVYVLIGLNKHQEAKDFQLKTIGIAFLLSGKDNALTLRNVQTLAWCYWRMGKQKLALGIMTSITNRSMIVLGADHPKTRQRAQNVQDWQQILGKKAARPKRTKLV